MSDSILYLAIVAIWAGFLIPAWIRRPHASAADSEADGDAPVQAEFGEFSAELTAEYQTENDVDVDLETDIYVEVSRRDQEYRDDVHTRAVTGSRSGAEPATGPPATRPSQSREQMLRARRRMLTILTALTVITGGFVAVGLVQWWICVPPLGMLALYVLLLREIAMADAELARKRQAWAARVERERAREAARHAWEAEAARPGAQIIDISSRVGDQLYDQYADAAVRAVGD